MEGFLECHSLELRGRIDVALGVSGERVVYTL